MTVHYLKCRLEYFERVESGQKKFEIRKNDRDYQVNDILILGAWDWKENRYLNSDQIRAKVTYITDFAQQEGYVVMGIELEQ